MALIVLSIAVKRRIDADIGASSTCQTTLKIADILRPLQRRSVLPLMVAPIAGMREPDRQYQRG